MITIHTAMNPPIGTIPVLDWNGSEFLLFYIVALIGAVVWTRVRARHALDSFGRAGHHLKPTDPYEIAYLAAGPPQVARLAVVRLIHQGLVTWKSGWFTPKIVFQHDRGGGKRVEMTIIAATRRKGSRGLAVKEIPMLIKDEMRPLEVRLATLGLRPTHDEARKAGFRAVFPLIALILLGCAKLAIGIARDKPVWFLVLLLVVSVVILFVMVQPASKLTIAGKEVLDQYRNERTRAVSDDPSGLECLSLNVALFGTAALVGMPLFEGIRNDLNRQLNQTAASGSDGGCSAGSGTSSGCGGGGRGVCR